MVFIFLVIILVLWVLKWIYSYFEIGAIGLEEGEEEFVRELKNVIFGCFSILVLYFSIFIWSNYESILRITYFIHIKIFVAFTISMVVFLICPLLYNTYKKKKKKSRLSKEFIMYLNLCKGNVIACFLLIVFCSNLIVYKSILACIPLPARPFFLTFFIPSILATYADYLIIVRYLSLKTEIVKLTPSRKETLLQRLFADVVFLAIFIGYGAIVYNYGAVLLKGLHPIFVSICSALSTSFIALLVVFKFYNPPEPKSREELAKDTLKLLLHMLKLYK